MKVSQLIKYLSQLPQDLDVVITDYEGGHTEDLYRPEIAVIQVDACGRHQGCAHLIDSLELVGDQLCCGGDPVITSPYKKVVTFSI